MYHKKIKWTNDELIIKNINELLFSSVSQREPMLLLISISDF